MTEVVGLADIGRRRRIVTVAAACIGVTIVVLAGLATWRWQRDRAYVGTTVSVTLDWSCGNGIFWRGTSAHATWWAGHNPAPTGTLDTQAPGAGSPPSRHAEGKLHFTSYRNAVFTSTAGGTLTMTRQPRNAFYTADCFIGFGPPG